MKQFKLSLDRFEIIALDNYNFGLYETREKKSFRGKKSQGETKELHGYYSDLASALNKIGKLAFLREDELCIVQDLKEATEGLTAHLNERFGNIKPKQFSKNEILHQGGHYE